LSILTTIVPTKRLHVGAGFLRMVHHLSTLLAAPRRRAIQTGIVPLCLRRIRPRICLCPGSWDSWFGLMGSDPFGAPMTGARQFIPGDRPSVCPCIRSDNTPITSLYRFQYLAQGVRRVTQSSQCGICLSPNSHFHRVSMRTLAWYGSCVLQRIDVAEEQQRCESTIVPQEASRVDHHL
jgi:hypothetical protein